MRLSRHCQFTWKSAVVVLAYSVILPAGWTQDKGTGSNLPARNAEVASVNPAVTQPSATDRLASTPATSRPATLEADATAEKPTATPDREYVIGPQDLLAINVWREPEISRSVPVRPDGKISLPLVGEMTVSGLTPHLLETHLAKELETYIRSPKVTVIVQEANSHKFYIIGEVEHPSAYPLATRMTVLNALAMAGGFRDFAKVQQIYLLRLMPDGSRKRLRFDYKAAVSGKTAYQDLELQAGDTLVVP
jgi:polysaccharide biosynthesis/export protein